jgi:RNA polymerase sigma-70 factor (ECF subfamily)
VPANSSHGRAKTVTKYTRRIRDGHVFPPLGVTDSRPAAYRESVSAVESLPAGRPDARIARPTFAAVAAAHLDDVYRYLLYLTKDGTVAEDLTADTFEHALRRWRRFDPTRGSARTWLCQLARTTALDHFRADARRRRREERYTRDEPVATDPIAVTGLSEGLERGLSVLSASEREVIALRIVVELDGPEAARVLGISQTACSTRLSRALQHLKEEVTRND